MRSKGVPKKVSAQDSKKLKKEYLDNMEDYDVKACTDEDPFSVLHKRIEQLEKQNKTLASQLEQLQDNLVSVGFQMPQNPMMFYQGFQHITEKISEKMDVRSLKSCDQNTQCLTREKF